MGIAIISGHFEELQHCDHPNGNESTTYRLATQTNSMSQESKWRLLIGTGDQKWILRWERIDGRLRGGRTDHGHFPVGGMPDASAHEIVNLHGRSHKRVMAPGAHLCFEYGCVHFVKSFKRASLGPEPLKRSFVMDVGDAEGSGPGGWPVCQ
jgi:hypothetical protein